MISAADSKFQYGRTPKTYNGLAKPQTWGSMDSQSIISRENTVYRMYIHYCGPIYGSQLNYTKVSLQYS